MGVKSQKCPWKIWEMIKNGFHATFSSHVQKKKNCSALWRFSLYGSNKNSTKVTEAKSYLMENRIVFDAKRALARRVSSICVYVQRFWKIIWCKIIWNQYLKPIFEANIWSQYLKPIFEANIWSQYLMQDYLKPIVDAAPPDFFLKFLKKNLIPPDFFLEFLKKNLILPDFFISNFFKKSEISDFFWLHHKKILNPKK